MSKPIRSDERFFRAALAAAPGDAAARLLLAEWLAERGDERSEGYRWMARHHKYPLFLGGRRMWAWTDAFQHGAEHNHLPAALFDALPQPIDSIWKSYRKQHEAEEDLARQIDAIEEEAQALL
jgi:uncharacterized protein (TIGR02996 family)